MVFYLSPSDNKSPQVSRILPRILVYLDNAVVWIDSNRPLISMSSSPYTKPLVIVRSEPITIGFIITFMFYSLFSSRIYLFSLSYSFTLQSVGMTKSIVRQVLVCFCFFVLFFWLSQGLIVWPRLDDPCVSQKPNEFCAPHFLGRILGCAYNICSYG